MTDTSFHTSIEKISISSQIFAQKAARSIIEIQPSVNNLADVVLLLEVLGYNNQFVQKNGFDDLFHLANVIFEFIDMFEKNSDEQSSLEKLNQNRQKTILEALALVFPWLGSLSLLFIFGISLWMAWGMSLAVTTSFIAGVFGGLLISEGILHAFTRLFSFHFYQNNIGESKRILKRAYVFSIPILSGFALLFYAIGNAIGISENLIGVSILSMITIFLHRISYMVIFALKKLIPIIMGYSFAFMGLLSIYFSLEIIFPDNTMRYFASLLTAFIILTSVSIYYHYKIIKNKTDTKKTLETPHFFVPAQTTDKTIKSNFQVQLWETIPNFFFGCFYFLLLFSDRIISWVYNPEKAFEGSDFLPFAFNAIYHTGADFALLIVFASTILQYIIMTPIFDELKNLEAKLKITETNKLQKFFMSKYKKVIFIPLLSSLVIFGILYVFVENILPESSIGIFRIAALGNVFLTIFSANVLFLSFLNQNKIILTTMGLSVFLVITLGFFLGADGFERIVYAYLISSIFASIFSTFCMINKLKKSDTLWLSKFV